MSCLTEQQKVFIIKGLACFDTPSQVAQAVREEFGFEIDRRRIQEYDPERAGYRGVGKKLKAVFEETRRQFLDEAGEVPLTSKAYRLRVLNRLLVRAESSGNTPLVLQILEQAAKETGGAFTNRRELTGAKGGPIQAATQSTTMTPDEFRNIAKKLLEEV